MPMKSGGVGYFPRQFGKHSEASHSSRSGIKRYPMHFQTSVLTSRSLHSMRTILIMFSFANSASVGPPSLLNTNSCSPTGPRQIHSGSAAGRNGWRMSGLTTGFGATTSEASSAAKRFVRLLLLLVHETFSYRIGPKMSPLTNRLPQRKDIILKRHENLMVVFREMLQYSSIFHCWCCCGW